MGVTDINIWNTLNFCVHKMAQPRIDPRLLDKYKVKVAGKLVHFGIIGSSNHLKKCSVEQIHLYFDLQQFFIQDSF